MRSCWSDPVGWPAGLDKEAPSPQAEQQVIKDRIIELDDQLSAAAEELGVRGDELRRARAGLRALGSSRMSGDPAPLARLETVVGQIRQRRQMLAAEREALVRASAHGLPPESPHAHLRHRAVPNVAPARRRNRVLRAWSAASASLLLAGLAVIVAGHAGALLPALGGLAVFMLGAEAFARRHLLRFAAGLIAAITAAVLAWAAVLAALSNWRPVIAGLLILAAVILLLANIRELLRQALKLPAGRLRSVAGPFALQQATAPPAQHTLDRRKRRAAHCCTCGSR